MVDNVLIMGLAMIASVIIYLIIGIIMLRLKGLDDKMKKTFGYLLLGMSFINFVIFNAFPLKLVEAPELASLVLFFAIPFGEGLTMLVVKSLSDKLRKAFGVLLIALFAVWLITAVLSA
ncbi:hypothetical protein JXB28_02550 [Candidatus Woesearchaeota archaeon]|nr:hypothetical protein [Candidatus Woesearchaeota archaeon]